MLQSLQQLLPIIVLFLLKNINISCVKKYRGWFITNSKRKYLAKSSQSVSRKGIKMMGRWCFVGHNGAVVLWDELHRQSVHGWGWKDGETEGPLPFLEDQLQFGWLFFKVRFFSDLWAYLGVSLCSPEILRSRAKRGSSCSSPLTSTHKTASRDNSFSPVEHLLVNITKLWIFQFSWVLDGSTSLWPNGSASTLHLLAGLSCAVSVSLGSIVGSREPFRSWLGALGWLHPLELLSGMGGGASTTGWEGPLDWTDSGLTTWAGCNWALSIGWLEPWLTIPVKEQRKISSFRPLKHWNTQITETVVVSIQVDVFGFCLIYNTKKVTIISTRKSSPKTSMSVHTVSTVYFWTSTSTQWHLFLVLYIVIIKM